MRKKLVRLSIFVVAFTLIFSACSPSSQLIESTATLPQVENQPTEKPTVVPPTSEPSAETEASQPGNADTAINFVDGTGKQVQLAALPERIVVAGKATPYVLNTLFLFPNVADKLVGLEIRGAVTQEFLTLVEPDLEFVGVLEGGSGPEQIASHNPDLVIMKNISLGKLGKALEEIKIPVMGVNLETPSYFYEDIRALGIVLDDQTRADEIIAYYQTKEKIVADLLADLSDADKPSVLVLEYSEDGGEVVFSVPPVSYLQTTMVKKAGGNPIWTEVDGGADGWIQIGLEQIAVWNPDIILVIHYKGESAETAKELAASPNWQGLKAVDSGNVYGFPKDYASWDLIDPRWILGQLWLTTIIQPERSMDIDVTAEVVEFYKQMYGLSDEEINNSILPRLEELALESVP